MKRQICESLLTLRSIGVAAAVSFAPAGACRADPEKVRSAAADVLNETGTPGAVVAYRSDDESKDVFALGYADPKTNRPMTDDLVFPVGSLAKPFVAALFLNLADEGLLDRNAVVGDYLTLPKPVSLKTLKSLGDHTARLPDAIRNKDFQEKIVAQPGRSWTTKEILPHAFARTPFEPSGVPRYSNTHTILLGMVIEEATGKPLSEMLREKVLLPFGMENTHLRLDGLDDRERPRGYRYAKPDWPIGYGNALTDVTELNVSWTNAAGSLFATADDLLKACRPLTTGSDLSEESRQFLTHWIDNATGTVAYGFGLEKWSGWIGHRGDVPGYQAFWGYHPEKQIELVVLANLSNLPDGPGPAERIASAVFEALKRP